MENSILNALQHVTLIVDSKRDYDSHNFQITFICLFIILSLPLFLCEHVCMVRHMYGSRRRIWHSHLVPWN